MGFRVEEDRIAAAEQELGRRLPQPLRKRLLRESGGELGVSGYPKEDDAWRLHPVWAPSDRRRAARTTDHLVHETRELGDALPSGMLVIASNGTGDLIVLPAGTDDVAWWDHETHEIWPVVVDRG